MRCASVDPRPLDARERVELTLGFAETLFLEDRFLAAAEMFAPLLDSSSTLGAGGPRARARLVGDGPRPPRRRRGRRRSAAASIGGSPTGCRRELARDPGSGPADYWPSPPRAAPATSTGPGTPPWPPGSAPTLGADRGVTLRGDLDRLVIHGVIPERARVSHRRDPASRSPGCSASGRPSKRDGIGDTVMPMPNAN